MKKKKRGRGRPLRIGSGARLLKDADAYFAEIKERNKNPLDYTPLTVEGLCNHIGMDARVFYLYIDRDDDLGRAAWLILQRITQNRVEDGLVGRQNPLLVKFLLTNNAKFFYKDKQEVEHSVGAETRTLLQQLEGRVNKI